MCDDKNMTDMESALLLIADMSEAKYQKNTHLTPRLSNSHLIYAADVAKLMENPFAKKLLGQEIEKIRMNKNNPSNTSLQSSEIMVCLRIP
jgi:hypothetical protein